MALCYDILEDLGDDLSFEDYFHFIRINDLTSEMIQNIFRLVEFHFYIQRIWSGDIFDTLSNLVILVRSEAIKNITIVKWIYYNRPDFFDTGEDGKTVMDYACGGSLRVVRWLHKKGFVSTKYAFIMACMKGNMRVVKWLHSHRVKIFTNQDYVGEVIPIASIYNHIEMVKWLHLNGYPAKSGDMDSMYLACKRGFLDLVKYFDEGLIKFDACYLEFACIYGHHEIIKWAHDNHPECFDMSRVVLRLCERNHIDSVKWLCNHDNSAVEPAIDASCRFNNKELIKWLHETYY